MLCVSTHSVNEYMHFVKFIGAMGTCPTVMEDSDCIGAFRSSGVIVDV